MAPSQSTASPHTQQPQASLGLAMALSLVIGTMIGGGIYVMPASLAPLGWNAVLGWVISGGGALCLAASLRFLMQDSGEGFHAVIERVLGPVPAFLAIWAFWIAGFVSIAALTVAAGTVAADLIFSEPPRNADIALSLAFLGVATLVNLAGTRSAGFFQVLTVIVKVLPLLVAILLIAGFAFAGGEPQKLAQVPITFVDVSQAVAITLFALLDFEMVAVPVQKIRNPGRNVPIALIGGTCFVVAVYVLVSTGVVLILPWEEIAASSGPVADLLTLKLG
ncbi:MAG: amino acid permease, partial [Erythrobacter sp.]|nr:amino acid permease [Erythrobacter sp.]